MGIRTVLVTGGAGFIGSYLCHELVDRGYCVLALDNLATGREANISRLDGGASFRFLRGDILDTDLLSDVMRGVDAVFHEAAIPSVQRSIDDPRRTTEVNVSGTLEILIAAKNAGIRKVILASSSSVYGDVPTLPKKEDMSPNPKSIYAASKLAGECYATAFNSIYGMSNICLRYFNVYGPMQNPDSEYAAVIPRLVSHALEGSPFHVFGTGMQTRDFTYVKDVVQANMLALESQVSGVFNIGSGKRISINELVQLIGHLVGRNLDIAHIEARKGDVIDSLADISKANGEFGYQPLYSIERGLAEMIEWFRKVK